MVCRMASKAHASIAMSKSASRVVDPFDAVAQVGNARLGLARAVEAPIGVRAVRCAEVAAQGAGTASGADLEQGPSDAHSCVGLWWHCFKNAPSKLRRWAAG